MEYILDIVIPKEEINKIDLQEQLVSWGEEIFSRDPRKFVSGSNLVFEQAEDLEYYSRLLNENLDADKYIALCLKDKSLYDLDFIVNTKKNELNNNGLVNFLSELIPLREFYIFLLREDEPIKQKSAVKNKNELIALLCDSMEWSNQKDILIQGDC